MPYLGPLHPEPLPLQQATADLYHTGDTQTQFWLSLCGVSGSWCAQGLNPLSASGAIGFASKHDFAPPTILPGRLCPWTWSISSELLQQLCTASEQTLLQHLPQPQAATILPTLKDPLCSFSDCTSQSGASQ